MKNLFWRKFHSLGHRNLTEKTCLGKDEFTIKNCRTLGNSSSKWEWQMGLEPLIKNVKVNIICLKLLKT